MIHCQILDLRVIVQNCKIGTSTLMTSSSDVAWKMTSYRAESQLKFVTLRFKQFKPKKENKMSAILIQLQNVLRKSNSAKMISSDIALVQK